MYHTDFIQEPQITRTDAHTGYSNFGNSHPLQGISTDEDEARTHICGGSSFAMTPRCAEILTLPPTTKSRMCEGQLYRAKSSTEGLQAHMTELDRFCLLNLEQTLQCCRSAESKAVSIQKIEKHQSLRETTATLLAQLPEMVKMQAEVEKYQWSILSPAVANQLKIDIKPRTTISASMLQQFSLQQLKLIAEDLQYVLCDLSRTLVEELTERDGLYLTQGAKCTEIEDLSAYFKELCIRTSIQRVRTKALSSISADQDRTPSLHRRHPGGPLPVLSDPGSWQSTRELVRQSSFSRGPIRQSLPLFSRRRDNAPQYSQ